MASLFRLSIKGIQIKRNKVNKKNLDRTEDLNQLLIMWVAAGL